MQNFWVYPVSYKGPTLLVETLNQIAQERGRVIAVVPSPANAEMLLIIVELHVEPQPDLGV